METNAQTQQAVPESTVVNGNNTRLLPREVYRNDPWMVLLRDRLSLNNWLILGIIVLLSICCFYGLYVVLPGTGHGLANQPLFALLETVAATLFYIPYLWFPDIIAVLFNTLWTNDILDQSRNSQNAPASYAKFIKNLSFWLSRPWWPICILIFVISYLINRYLVHGPPFLNYVPFWLQLVTAILDGIIAYNAFMCVIWLLISLIFANRLFRSFTIHVKPLHPDKTGGLGVMRNIIWISALIILATTLTYFETAQLLTNRNALSSTLDIIVFLAAYIILTPSLILSWLVMPHLLMLRVRNAALKPLIDEFQAIMEYPQSITPIETANILADNDRLSAIKRRYDLICDTFPTWPLEVTQIQRLVGTLFLPALVALIPYLIDLINFIIQRLPK